MFGRRLLGRTTTRIVGVPCLVGQDMHLRVMHLRDLCVDIYTAG